MGRLSAKIDYEEIRIARILENQAKLASLGLNKTLADLRAVASSAKSVKSHVRKAPKNYYSGMPLRRSSRLTKASTTESPSGHDSLRRSNRLRGISRDPISLTQGKVGVSKKNREEETRPANMPLVKVTALQAQLSSDIMIQRCNSKSRGSVYSPVFGICCHFCRQKKLCGEEGCKRCGNLDIDEPCIGKTDCSVCHSSNGVLCRACLKVRYGEEMDEVRANKNWMCPHCIEEKGINPKWICNSSFCLKKRRMAPTGIAIFRAREMGYKSVAHLIMDELQQTQNRRR